MKDTQRLLFRPEQRHPKVMEVFRIYSDSIVDILKDCTFQEYEIFMQKFLELDIPFKSDIWDFFKQNEDTLAVFAQRHLELQELGGDTKKVFLKNNLYIKYINALKKRNIGLVKDEKVLDPIEREYWDRQYLFKTIIEDHILKIHHTSKGQLYRYTTVNDILAFFSGDLESKADQGMELYQNFINEKGDYDFNLSHDSIGKYLNSIERFFQKKRIRYNDGSSRLNIYTLVNDDLTL